MGVCHDPSMTESSIRLSAMNLGDGGTDVDDLAAFLAGNVFPFHAGRVYTPEEARASVVSGRWASSGTETYWVEADGVRIGTLTLDDLGDPTVMVDLRLAEAHRGRGLGALALRAVADEVFAAYPETRRIEGQTRDDNLAMRATFSRAGWVKEACFREGWEPGHDAIGYAMLRNDWESGTTTPVNWDEPTTIRPH